MYMLNKYIDNNCILFFVFNKHNNIVFFKWYFVCGLITLEFLKSNCVEENAGKRVLNLNEKLIMLK